MPGACATGNHDGFAARRLIGEAKTGHVVTRFAFNLCVSPLRVLPITIVFFIWEREICLHISRATLQSSGDDPFAASTADDVWITT